jgi:diguanylate cyclase (GGDEF)-like protein
MGDLGGATRVDASCMTSRLVLTYVEHHAGRPAVDRLLDLCGARELEPMLRDERQWMTFEMKVALYRAAAEVLGDPRVMRRVGASALDLNVAESLKLALRALGTPRLVYQNIVRANAKFTKSHSMELLELRSDFARVRFTDLADRPFEPMDCDYSQGMLACVPALFGLPHARLSHPVCAADGHESCIYELSWARGGHYARYALGCGAAAAAALAGALALAPALLPLAGAVAAGAGGLAARRTIRMRRARWRNLENEVRSHAEVTARLFQSMQDLVSELRLDELVAKIAANAQAAVNGKEFLLLLRDSGDGTLRNGAPSGLPADAIDMLERWANETPRLLDTDLLVDDLSTTAKLAALSGRADMQLGSLFAAPLVYRGRSLGVLLSIAPQAQNFLPRDSDLVKWYATQAAVALSNAQLYQAKEELASRDPLTGLLNHREFHETLERELERGRRGGERFSVALIDLDGFKNVNDESGHSEGDRLLTEVANALTGSSRAGDVAFRVGGDEFALLLPASGAADAALVAERIRQAIAALDDRMGASLGVASWPEDGDAKEALLSAADLRLYEMKRSGLGHDGEIARVAERLARRLGLEGEEVRGRLQEILEDLL